MITFLLSPLGRWLAGAAIILSLIGYVYLKGYSDGKNYIINQSLKESHDVIEKAAKARSSAATSVYSGKLWDSDGYRRD